MEMKSSLIKDDGRMELKHVVTLTASELGLYPPVTDMTRKLQAPPAGTVFNHKATIWL